MVDCLPRVSAYVLGSCWRTTHSLHVTYRIPSSTAESMLSLDSISLTRCSSLFAFHGFDFALSSLATRASVPCRHLISLPLLTLHPKVDILNRTAEVDLSNYVSNGEWDLLDAQMVRNVMFYSCCPEPFPDVTVTITIRRKTLYYMYNVVFPCLMMSVLTLLVFRLPPDSGEKVALGITVLLAFSVFMLTISEKLPETSESIPLLGTRVPSCLLLCS